MLEYPRATNRCLLMENGFGNNEKPILYTEEERRKYREKLISPKNDTIFKRLLGQKGDEDVLKDFLESILEIKINKLEFNQNTELLGNNNDEKDSRIDVCAELDGGMLVDIEMQAEPRDYDEERCLAYWSRLFLTTIKKATEYKSAKKTICIWLIDGTVYNKINNYQIAWKIKPDVEQDTNYFDKLEIHTIELNKFRKSSIIKPKKKEFWLWFIDHTNKEMVKMACTRYQEIKKLQDRLDELTADPGVEHELINIEFGKMDKRVALNRAREEGLAEGRAEGIKKGMAEGIERGIERGIEKGIAKEKINNIKNMLLANISLKKISEITGMSIEEIKNIKADK